MLILKLQILNWVKLFLPKSALNATRQFTNCQLKLTKVEFGGNAQAVVQTAYSNAIAKSRKKFVLKLTEGVPNTGAAMGCSCCATTVPNVAV